MKTHRSAIAALAVFALAAPLAAAAADHGAVHWTQHELRFNYFGFTSDYSCDGAKAKVEKLLERLGARDIEVHRRGCVAGPGQVEPFVNLNLKFLTLGEADPSRAPGVGMVWRPVVMGYNEPRQFQFGDCELVEQFRDQVLPAFSHRVVRDNLGCVPGQSRQWSLEVEVATVPSDLPPATSG